jgi:hypothetical protein
MGEIGRCPSDMIGINGRDAYVVCIGMYVRENAENITYM